MKWQVGNTCYFIQNNRWVCEAQIVSINGEFPYLRTKTPTLWTDSYFVSTAGGAPRSNQAVY